MKNKLLLSTKEKTDYLKIFVAICCLCLLTMAIYSLINRFWFTSFLTLTMTGHLFVTGILKPKNKYLLYSLLAIIILGCIYSLVIAIHVSIMGR